MHCNLGDQYIRKTADAIVRLGLDKVGYSYINMDDCALVDRAPNGTLIADPVRFPLGLRPVADYVHSLGLHYGVYTAQRELTCQDRPGSWRFEDEDIDTFW